MAVEKVLVPMRAIFGVGELGVEAHYRGEKLGDEQDYEAYDEFGIELERGV